MSSLEGSRNFASCFQLIFLFYVIILALYDKGRQTRATAFVNYDLNYYLRQQARLPRNNFHFKIIASSTDDLTFTLLPKTLFSNRISTVYATRVDLKKIGEKYSIKKKELCQITDG